MPLINHKLSGLMDSTNSALLHRRAPRVRITGVFAELLHDSCRRPIKVRMTDIGGNGFGVESDVAHDWKRGQRVRFMLRSEATRTGAIIGTAEIASVLLQANRCRVGLQASVDVVRRLRKLAARMVRDGDGGIMHTSPDDDECAIVAGRLSFALHRELDAMGRMRRLCLRRVVRVDPAGALLIVRMIKAGARVAECAPSIRAEMAIYGVCRICPTAPVCQAQQDATPERMRA